jgi:hypothetical protein
MNKIKNQTKVIDRFRKFLIKNHSNENLEFWEYVETYSTANNDQRILIARAIHKKYIKKGSLSPINISSQVKNDIEQNILLRPIPINLFQESAMNIEELLCNEYRRFCIL